MACRWVPPPAGADARARRLAQMAGELLVQGDTHVGIELLATCCLLLHELFAAACFSAKPSAACLPPPAGVGEVRCSRPLQGGPRHLCQDRRRAGGPGGKRPAGLGVLAWVRPSAAGRLVELPLLAAWAPLKLSPRRRAGCNAQAGSVPRCKLLGPRRCLPPTPPALPQVGVLVNNAGLSYDHPEYLDEVEDGFVSDIVTINALVPTMVGLGGWLGG